MNPRTRNRVALLAVAVLGLAGGIAARLYHLEVRSADAMQSRARRQHERQVEVWGRRGAIVDRRGRELAVSLDSSSLFAHPPRVQDARRAASLLAPVLDLSREHILAKLTTDEPFVWIRRRLDVEVANAVGRLGLPMGAGEALGFQSEAKRYYPGGPLAAHAVGFADIDQKGIEGIEKTFDEVLRGDSTGYLAVRDGRGASLLKLVHPPSREPKDVVLTIDLVVQHIVERELDRAMRDTGARWASAVLIDPRSGEILAMSNRPTADPNDFGSSSPEGRRNRAVTDAFEPGSTFKIVALAAGLDTGTVHPEQRFDCGNGGIQVAGLRIRDHKPFGVLSLREIVENSSNVGMVRVSSTLRSGTLSDYIVRFGFGDRTGIELPGEIRGLLAPPSQWSGMSAASLSFGHEIGVTTLQLAAAFAAVANDGVRVPPRIVLGTRDADGRFEPSARPESRRVVSSATAHTLGSILEGVIVRGTGGGAAVPGYRIAGKTGTAQKVIPGVGYSDELYVASFGGYGSIRTPRVAGLVVLDSPSGDVHSGGAVAAPVFGRILADTLAYLRVPPDEDPLKAGLPGPAGHAAPASYRSTPVRVGADTGESLQ